MPRTKSYNFKRCKLCTRETGIPEYRVRDFSIMVCSACGFHYINYLDGPEITGAGARDDKKVYLTPEKRAYIKNELELNKQKFLDHRELVQSYGEIKGLRVLDIGCGGGVFPALLQEQGAEVYGIEVNRARAEYARQKYGLTVFSAPLEEIRNKREFKKPFDIITLWDVIEHVNFPKETLEQAIACLRPGGKLFLDTPCRDGVYHRIGAFMYRLSRGRNPGFLSLLYSNVPLGHKQLFSTLEIKELLETLGMTVKKLEKIEELSLSYEFYLKKIFGNGKITRFLAPPTKVFFKLITIKNKIIAAGERARE
ncbi:MAG: class I SAM-dependent methyltransferase [bacterium]|nr:class I SAM-dependent methyltransferase [bacterium]